MTELEALKGISAYVAENKIKLALEGEENMVVEAYVLKKEGNLAIEPGPPDKPVLAKGNVNMKRLDCIYDDEPLEEVDLGENGDKRPKYISASIDKELKSEVISLLKEFKDCFAWDYNEMHGLSRDLVELKLPIKSGRKPVK
ncbi:unnamed protein product [Lathyrus oleraceus]